MFLISVIFGSPTPKNTPCLPPTVEPLINCGVEADVTLVGLLVDKISEPVLLVRGAVQVAVVVPVANEVEVVGVAEELLCGISSTNFQFVPLVPNVNRSS